MWNFYENFVTTNRRFIYLFKIKFIYFYCVGSSLLPMGFFLVAKNGGYSQVAVCGLLNVVASLVAEYTQALGA